MPVETLAARKTVIVADDTAFVRDRFRDALEDAGHRVVPVRSGAELLARVRENLDDLDLLVVDLRLPGANGVSLVQRLRKIHASKPPIVVFSGTIADAGEVRALGALGVAGYLNEYTAVQHIVPALLPHLSDEGHTPRRWPRAVLAIPVAFRVDNTIATAVTLNLSCGGLAIRSASPLAPGACVSRFPAAVRSARRPASSGATNGSAWDSSSPPSTTPSATLSTRSSSTTSSRTKRLDSQPSGTRIPLSGTA
jgi:CheY-like chemotaxis protein